MEVVKDGDVVLNFSDADVREIAQAVLGDALRVNFVVDAAINQRLTLRTSRPLSRLGLLPTLETSLAAAGLVLIKDQDLYRIVPASKAKSGASSIAIARGREAVPSGYGVMVAPLSHVSPSQMARILEPLAPEKSILRVDDARNFLILGGTAPDMKTMLETIDMFDVDQMQGMSFALLKLKKARLADLLPELKDVLKAHIAQTGAVEPQLVGLDRLNALLVIAPRAELLSLVKDWVTRLDQGENESEAKLFVYHVKNRKAQDLAGLLNTLFLSGDGGSRPPGDERRSRVPPGEAEVELRSEDAGVTLAKTPGASGRLTSEARIVADEDNNSLLIRATAKDYKTILAAVDKLDLVPPLVMIEVTIAEVKLGDNLKVGIEWFFKQRNSKYTFSAIDTGNILSKFPGFSYFFNAADVDVVLNAMSDVTDVKIVSSPKVMVRDNKTATLQIGDQIPIITSTSQSVSAPDAPVIQTVRYYDTGVILKVTPQVNAGGLISMDVNQEVSNVAAQSVDGASSPTIQQRKITSSIAIQSGEAVVLGGLIRETKSSNNTAVPLLSRMPGVGDLFKTHDKSAERSELVIIIKPRVVWGRSDARHATEELMQKMRELTRR
ncbi:MAG: type II secretion system secretin GspD [Hyphomicrobiales bacterium]|nr:type II secretion system secretin GspD [Hyphomicrobiales bacterium]